MHVCENVGVHTYMTGLRGFRAYPEGVYE